MIDTETVLDKESDSGIIKVAEGKNLVGKFTRREEYDLEIEDIPNMQGFDGLPKIAKSEKEFYDLVSKDHFIAERTISSDNAKDIEEWYQQLLTGDFYVKCTTGGYQYGRGLYCAADYTKGTIDYKDFLHEINQYSWNRKNVKTIWMSVDPSANIINNDDIQNEYAISWLKNKYPEKLVDIDKLNTKQKELRNFNITWDVVTGIPTEEYSNLKAEVNRLRNEVGYNDGIIYTNRRCKGNDGRHDLGVLASELGYDAINAKGHGSTGSYTVILNRTKLIIYDGETFTYKKR